MRQDFPESYIIYKPHPDVLAGLREGALQSDETPADIILEDVAIDELLSKVDRVATMTSLTGFEALLRGCAVTCYGMPFYAGWGLTDDRGETLKRRKGYTPSLEGLIHAVLIDYPLYWEPVTGEPASLEQILFQFETGVYGSPGGSTNRILSKLQGVFSSYSSLWR